MSKKVLVVDDSRMSRMMITAIIKNSFPEWEIFEAADAIEALKVCESMNIDMATLDMNMPGMDGLTLGIELRRLYPDAKLSMMTANVQEATREKAEAAGIGFIGKPVTEDKVVSFLEEGA
ncbi:MAG: response regulator [Gammaproteobacteria bacterium]